MASCNGCNSARAGRAAAGRRPGPEPRAWPLNPKVRLQCFDGPRGTQSISPSRVAVGPYSQLRSRRASESLIMAFFGKFHDS
eukprot:655149-Hanusia_phi.AAC.1